MTDLAGATRHPVTPPVAEPHSGGSLWALTLGSVGVVYGDIGTSPLYAFRVAVVAAAESGPVTRDTVLGVLSMIVWALVVVVTIKYVLVLLRSDNNGEGGTLSLTALASARSAGGRFCCCSVSSARRCSSATRSSPRPFRCCRRWRGSSS